MTGSKTRGGGVALVAVLAAIIIVLIVLGTLFPYILFIVVLGFIVSLAVLGHVYEKKSREKTALFKQGLRVEGGRLVLPEEADVELGEVVLKDYWTRTTPYSSSAKARVKLFPVFEMYILNPVKTRLKTVDLGELCSKPFFLFAGSSSGTRVLEAPGFKVSTGRFRDVAVVCLEQLNVPEKTVELEAGDPGEHGKARIRLDSKGLTAEVVWVFKVPVQRRVVYDEKHGVYKVVEEYTVKPRASGVKVERCIQTPSGKHCEKLAKAVEPNKPVKVAIPFTVKEELLVFDTAEPSTWQSTIKSAVESKHGIAIVGYKPECITARIVLEKRRRQKIVSEATL